MRQWIRSHLTYANVMVTILAFVVLGGGTALASFVVSSNSQIGPNTVSGHKPPAGDHANLLGGWGTAPISPPAPSPAEARHRLGRDGEAGQRRGHRPVAGARRDRRPRLRAR